MNKVLPGLLPEKGIRIMLEGWRGRSGLGNKTSTPPILIVDGEIEVLEYMEPLWQAPTHALVIWSWPGSYRNDVFQTTVGEILAEARKERP